jgi:hypothetical protein
MSAAKNITIFITSLLQINVMVHVALTTPTTEQLNLEMCYL